MHLKNYFENTNSYNNNMIETTNRRPRLNYNKKTFPLENQRLPNYKNLSEVVKNYI